MRSAQDEEGRREGRGRSRTRTRTRTRPVVPVLDGAVSGGLESESKHRKIKTQILGHPNPERKGKKNNFSSTF